MKRGFTLIELLITMVLVAVLATVALTKYSTTLERGRAMQAIAVLRDISDAWNAQYILDNNTYPNSTTNPDVANKWNADTIRIKHFGEPNVVLQTTLATISITRDDGSYTLTATNVGGELTKISCTDTNNGKDCLAIGMISNGSEYILD